MLETLALVIPGILIFALIWALLSGLLGTLYPAIRAPVCAMSAAWRSWLLLLISALPAVIAALTTVLLFVPAFGQPLVSSHCHGDAGCAAHVPSGITPSLAEGLALPALIVLGLLVWRASAMWVQHRWRLRQLRQLASSPGDGRYALLDCATPMALTAGLWHAQIFISSGLVRELDAGQLQTVLAHEMAHVRRHDNLRFALARFLAPGWLGGSGRPLYQDLRAAAEQCCDAAAARDLGDPLRVAEALIRAQRALPAPANGIASPQMPERIAQLIREPDKRPLLGSLTLLSLIVIATLLAMLGVNLMHHGTESLLVWMHH